MNNLTDMKLSNSPKGRSLRDTGTEVRRSGSILKVTVSTNTPHSYTCKYADNELYGE